MEAVPLALDRGYTRLADPGEAVWIGQRFRRACDALGTDVTEHHGRLIVEWRPGVSTRHVAPSRSPER
jgi:poly-gamma-glutamate synthesis protein (capsule biosynthesis protein)